MGKPPASGSVHGCCQTPQSLANGSSTAVRTRDVHRRVGAPSVHDSERAMLHLILRRMALHGVQLGGPGLCPSIARANLIACTRRRPSAPSRPLQPPLPSTAPRAAASAYSTRHCQWHHRCTTASLSRVILIHVAVVVLRSKAGFSPDLESTRMWDASLEKANQPSFGICGIRSSWLQVPRFQLFEVPRARPH